MPLDEMARKSETDAVLARMAAVLLLGNNINWAAALERCRAVLWTDWDEARRSIRGSYGGMGSLNDIVLYADGVVLTREQEEFDRLRHRLYELVQLQVEP